METPTDGLSGFFQGAELRVQFIKIPKHLTPVHNVTQDEGNPQETTQDY